MLWLFRQVTSLTVIFDRHRWLTADAVSLSVGYRVLHLIGLNVKHVVVVEDSEALNALLCRALENDGYQVEGFLDAESLLESPALKDAQIIVLDVYLPGESGIALASRLRHLMPDLGILMLTTRTTNAERIEGYDAGADYYLPKPVTPDELCDAVRSLCLRKSRLTVSPASVAKERCVLSRAGFALSFRGRVLKISNADNKILVALASAPNQQMEYWQILEVLNAERDLISRRALDVRVHRLRAKLAELLDQETTIVSIRGIGYRLGFELEVR